MSSATATATATATSNGGCCPPAPTPKETVFYYRKYVNGDPTQPNSSEFVNLTQPETYSGCIDFWGANQDGSVNKDQLITYVGFRIPPNQTLGLPPIFNETLNLNVKPFRDNYLQAVSTYEDSGSGSTTAVNSNVFAVTTGIGMFKDAKTVLVEYDNDTYFRKVIVRNY